MTERHRPLWIAACLVLRARRLWSPALARLERVPATARPDLADEIATLVATLMPGRPPARRPTALDALLRSAKSTRRPTSSAGW